jgi:hypothetical protein
MAGSGAGKAAGLAELGLFWSGCWPQAEDASTAAVRRIAAHFHGMKIPH